jgi:AcrR family transcriptional regulator
MREDRSVGDTETTTPAGRYLQQRMDALGFKAKVDLARAADVSPSTITRLFGRADYRPDVDVMRRLARGLQVEHDDLVAAIYGEQPEPAPTSQPPLAAELGRLLADDSPLAEETRLVLTVLVDRVLDLGRRQARTAMLAEGDMTADFLRALRNEALHGSFPGAKKVDPADYRPVSRAELEAVAADPLEAKLEVLWELAGSLSPTNRGLLAAHVQMLVDWTAPRIGTPEPTDQEREDVEHLQRVADANNRAVREYMARGGKPAERRTGRS